MFPLSRGNGYGHWSLCLNTIPVPQVWVLPFLCLRLYPDFGAKDIIHHFSYINLVLNLHTDLRFLNLKLLTFSWNFSRLEQCKPHIHYQVSDFCWDKKQSSIFSISWTLHFHDSSILKCIITSRKIMSTLSFAQYKIQSNFNIVQVFLLVL